MNKKDIREMMYDDEDQHTFGYTKRELLEYGTRNYWWGIAIGALGMFILCLGVGLLIP